MRLDKYTSAFYINGILVQSFASEEVPLETKAFDQLRDFLTEVNKTASNINPSWEISECIITPDFHKGFGIPIGTVFSSNFVVPKAIGNDIGCGMRLTTTDLFLEDIKIDKSLERKLRYVFFEGGRGIYLTGIQRENIFKYGNSGLLESSPEPIGIWEHWDYSIEQKNVVNEKFYGMESFKTEHIAPFIPINSESSYDSQIGSIGGGNHFVEVQYVDKIINAKLAYQYGLKKGQICIMAHSGSIGYGHLVNNYFNKSINNEKFPVMKITDDYFTSMNNAVNYASVNRMFLTLMVVKSLRELYNTELKYDLVYDVPHNFAQLKNGNVIHRKGACPADSDQPVIIPGSMGDFSYIMNGLGNLESLNSSCHGAGRVLNRRSARKNKFSLNNLNIITKVDIDQLPYRIKSKLQSSLLEEGPSAYKPITPIIDTIEGAGIANRVVSLKPLLTIKQI